MHLLFRILIIALRNCARLVEKKTKEFLSSVSYDHWANAYFPGKRYGEMSSNAVVSFNSWIREARKMSILQCVDEIRVQIMRQMYERKQLSRKWCSVVS